MQFVSAALVIVLAASLALWPVAFLAGVFVHVFAKQWRRLGQVAFLLPLWTIAASVCLTQLAPFVAAFDGPAQGRSPFIPVVAMGFALCCAALVWALLSRSFERQSSSASSQEPVS